jgi:hypothetical protein
MSTIAARAHPGAILTAPAKRTAPARRKLSRLAGMARAIGRRPGRSLTFLLFAGAAGIILSNALFFQKMRHPAPMLSAPQVPHARTAERKAEPVQATAPAAASIQAATAAQAPVPPSRPPVLAQPAREAGPRPPASVTNVARTASSPPPATAAQRAAPPQRDPIADLINGDIRPPGDIKGVATAKSSSPRRTAEN